MRARHNWTDEQRRAALAAIREFGLAEAHRRTGVPKQTLSRWNDGTGNGTSHREQVAAAVATTELSAAERRAHLKLRFLEEAEIELTRLRQNVTIHKLASSGKEVEVHLAEPEPSDRRAIATTAAILLDKHLLLDGQSTSRIETVDDTRRTVLAEQIERRLRIVPPLEGAA